MVDIERDELSQAIQSLYRALPLIDPGSEPRLALCAFHNLALALEASGRLPETRRAHRQARFLHERFPELSNHRLWLEGNIAGSMGRRIEAEIALQQALEGFLSAGSPELAGLVARDLAALRVHR
jgi:hypothetical protein